MPTRAETSTDDYCLPNRVILAWATPYAIRGFFHTLTPDELPSGPRAQSPENFAKLTHKAWKQLREATKPGCAVPMVRHFCSPVAGKLFLQGALLEILSGFLAGCGRPLILSYALRALDPDQGYSFGASIGLAVGLALAAWIENWARYHGSFLMFELGGFRCCGALVQLITVKSVRLRQGAAKVGLESSLIGSDCLGALGGVGVLPLGVCGVATLIAGVTMLLVTLGSAALVGLSLLFTTMMCNFALYAPIKRLSTARFAHTDARVQVMREAIDGAKVIKLQQWEEKFLSLLDSKRTAELRSLRILRLLQVLIVSLGRAAPIVAAAISFVTASAVGVNLQPSTIFPALSIFLGMRTPFVIIPITATIWAQTRVSLARIGRYVMLPDQPARDVISEEETEQTEQADGSALLLDVRDATLAWGSEEAASPPVPIANGRGSAGKAEAGAAAGKAEAGAAAGKVEAGVATDKTTAVPPQQSADTKEATPEAVLTGVNVCVHGGELVAVIGPVGSGKTTLLSAAWGDCTVRAGVARAAAEVAIVPQKAILLAGTVAENILIGRALDAGRMAAVVEQCALVEDIEALPRGLETEVGERGVTLSGGQQQRIALARALYGEPRLLVLDDPLSAVDVRTQKLLLHTLSAYVHGADKDSTSTGANGTPARRRGAFVAMNEVHHLHAFDRVVELREGRLLERSPSDFADEPESIDGQELESTSVAGADDGEVQPTAAKPADAEPAPTVSSTSKTPRAASDDPAATPVEALVTAERIRKGGFESALLFAYFRKFGRLTITVYVLTTIVMNLAIVISDVLLNAWSREVRREAEEAATLSVSNATAGSLNQSQLLGLYIGASGLQALLMVSASIVCIVGSVAAGRALHHETAWRILRAPLAWYDATPSGRIMSRFTADLGQVDVALPNEMDNFVQMNGVAIATMALVGSVARPVMSVLCPLGLLVYAAIMVFSEKSAREVKRIADARQAALLGSAAEARHGAAMFRALNAEAFVADRQAVNISMVGNAFFMFRALSVWGLHMSMHAASFLGLATALYIVIAIRYDLLGTALASLALTYAFVVPYLLGIAASFYVNLRVALTALERLLQYLHIPNEPPQRLPADPPSSEWPRDGGIEFEGVSIRYRRGLPLAVDSMSATIPARQKTAIIGRTGSGKSSLILALFRIVEPEAGSIRIDGLEVKGLGLTTWRSVLNIIPQEPVLHQGDVHHNLDPFSAKSDAEVADALVRARLPASMLTQPVQKGGGNLSSGERQLLCFARALLHAGTRPILVLDEATSNLDTASDDACQALLRTEFNGMTVLTIAHRLTTVIDFDQMLIMGGGKLLEVGRPSTLLDDDASVLSELSTSLGKTASKDLRRRSLASMGSFSVSSSSAAEHI